MTVLAPMPAEAFAAFVEIAVASYAADNVASGRWLEHEAVQLARAEAERLLPDGITTPDNHFYEIKAEAEGAAVGFLWFTVLARGGRRMAYICLLQVHPQFRRRGHARSAMAALEPLAVSLGMSGIALNVFGSNVEAQELYRASGFVVTSIGMHKDLPPDAG